MYYRSKNPKNEGTGKSNNGLYPLQKHLHTMGIYSEEPSCILFNEEDEIATRIISNQSYTKHADLSIRLPTKLSTSGSNVDIRNVSSKIN